jgi:hypothetical protein
VGQSGYRHWQILAVFHKQVRLGGVKDLFGNTAHCEPSRSSAADEYVWKDDTSVEGSRFSLGSKPKRANSAVDWDEIWASAIRGGISSIPANIRVQHYRTLKQIACDFAKPIAMERSCIVYHGPTGTGKSRRAWTEAGVDAYSKNSRSKYWDGYQGQTHVIMDEFRGGIDIAYLLTWLDRYPNLFDVKHSAAPNCMERMWICSNLHPSKWWPDLDPETYAAFERRCIILLIE